MDTKPLVGVNVNCPADRLSRRGFSDARLPQWLDCVTLAGGIPILIPRIHESSDLERALEPLDGFVFAGPADDPVWANADSVGELPPPELGLLRLIAERQLPFLGLGSGLQLLNVALGGSHATLAEVARGRASHVHAHNPRHPLRTSPGSVMAKLFGRQTGPVGSAHAMAVAELAVGLRATAWSEDGIIEAVENETPDWFALSVQFLPEADAGSDDDLRLFAVLIEQAVIEIGLNASRRRSSRKHLLR